MLNAKATSCGKARKCRSSDVRDSELGKIKKKHAQVAYSTAKTGDLISKAANQQPYPTSRHLRSKVEYE